MKRIQDHVKNYIIAYLTAVMVYGMVFGICIEQAHADNAPVAAEHLLSRTRHDIAAGQVPMTATVNK